MFALVNYGNLKFCQRPNKVGFLTQQMGLFNNRSHRHQNVVKTSLTHSPAAGVPLFCFYHILLHL